MFRHGALLDSNDLNPNFILKIQLGEEEETRMMVLDEEGRSVPPNKVLRLG